MWPTNNEYLKRLLGVYWLRPETALMRTGDCAFVRDFCRDSLEGKRNLEMGCGNGLLSFLMGGGNICSEYDVFLDIDKPELYSTTDKDIFDKVSDKKINYDDSNLQYVYEFACDWKEGLLSQAGRFKKLYKELRQADLNEDVEFFGEYDTIFCNMIYWLKDPCKALKDWHKLLAENGRIILFCANETFGQKAWFYFKAPHTGKLSYLNYFDRGYGNMGFHHLTDNEWRNIFKNAGYNVVEFVNGWSDVMMQIYNIGTRPIFSPLTLMAERLTAEDRQEIKEYWIDFFYKFFIPIIEENISERKNIKGAMNYYVLEKV